jgi:hypothetical protein
VQDGNKSMIGALYGMRSDFVHKGISEGSRFRPIQWQIKIVLVDFLIL